jgi:hypothetical protein
MGWSADFEEAVRGASPAAIECFDILSLFGDSEVTSQLDRLNSSDTYRVE